MVERSLIWRVTAILMTGILILSAIVQWNDPDPLRWILCYSATAIITLCSLIRPLPPSIPLIWGIIVLLSSLFVGTASLDEREAIRLELILECNYHEERSCRIRQGIGRVAIGNWLDGYVGLQNKI